MESFTYTLTAEQREHLRAALDDAWAYRESEDEVDYQEVDRPLQVKAEALYRLFGFDPDFIGN